jgi:hypothetical protein
LKELLCPWEHRCPNECAVCFGVCEELDRLLDEKRVIAVDALVAAKGVVAVAAPLLLIQPPRRQVGGLAVWGDAQTNWLFRLLDLDASAVLGHEGGDEVGHRCRRGAHLEEASCGWNVRVAGVLEVRRVEVTSSTQDADHTQSTVINCLRNTVSQGGSLAQTA